MPSLVMSSVSLMLCSYLMLLFQVQEGRKATVLRSCPPGWQDWNSECYALFTTPKPWYDAELYCQNWPSGHLLSVRSAFEAAFVSFLVKSSRKNYDYIWIGIHDPSMGQESIGGGPWQWSNNDEISYSNWEWSPSREKGYCGCLTAYSGYLKWKDYHCNKSLPYICKYRHHRGLLQIKLFT